MPVELKIATLGALLLFVHVFVAVRYKTAQYGRAWNVGARDEELPPANPVTGRLIRAHPRPGDAGPRGRPPGPGGESAARVRRLVSHG